MAKKQKKKPVKKAIIEKKEEAENINLHHDTKKSVWAVMFVGAAAILLLARFENAGPAGNFFYKIFDGLFGVGYYLLPLMFIVIAGVFLFSERQKLYKTTALGAAAFVLAGLGLIDIFFPNQGGFIGSAVGALQKLFGYSGSIVILFTVAVASLLITLNLPIRLKNMFRRSVIPSEARDLEAKDLRDSSVAPPAAGLPQNDDQETEVKEAVVVAASPAKAKKFGSALPKQFGDYVFPPLDLLRSSVEKPTVGDLRTSANIIKRTLESFGIAVEMGEINIGPKVTRYTLKPAEGVKLSRLTALNSDLALALAAHPIRIEAPIPGKSLVGIEVPNKAAAVVRLGSLLNYAEFQSAGLLNFSLGRDVQGESILADIEKMPHLLIAGATGSGKSIALHSLLISLLYKNSPQTLRMILIDPKRVELTAYNNLPHLVAPVITHAKKSVAVFRWAIDEMDKRYEILMAAGARDIKSYNKKNTDAPLPFILIVVDELADLMATYGREVEGAIVRLAQMARATGLHLILSTQRPSVEVITGLIKANITSRMALQVASQVDSRTILDMSGAEKLLGAGDMLFISSEISKPKRIQGAYVSEEEIRKVADFIKEHNPSLLEDMASPAEFSSLSNSEENSAKSFKSEGEDIFEQYSKAGGENGDDDELLEEAIQVVKEAQKASASLLQRRLKIGYARAARLLDIMEEKGIVGPGDGAKPREVYIEKNI